MTDASPVDPPAEIIQPCSEACACFRQLTTGGWTDYGICTNPVSPLHGCPVRLGRDCRHYRTRSIGPAPTG